MSHIRPTLAKALPRQLPPKAWDSRDLEDRARKSIRRNRLGAAGAALATLVAVAIAVPILIVGSDEDGPGPATHSLPALDPDAEYGWTYEPAEPSAATGLFDKSLRKYLKQHPELNIDDADDLAPVMARQTRELWTAVPVGGEYEYGEDIPGSKLVYREPVYTLTGDGDERGIIFDGADTDMDERLDVTVHPKGGYEPGFADVSDDPSRLPRPQYLAAGCQGYKHPEQADTGAYVEFNCTTLDSKQGNEIDAVERTEVLPDKTVTVTWTVVVYRDDGTAVVVSDTVNAPKRLKISLSPADLAGIAESLPDVPVT